MSLEGLIFSFSFIFSFNLFHHLHCIVTAVVNVGVANSYSRREDGSDKGLIWWLWATTI
jgi:hypothetical protein